MIYDVVKGKSVIRTTAFKPEGDFCERMYDPMPDFNDTIQTIVEGLRVEDGQSYQTYKVKNKTLVEARASAIEFINYQHDQLIKSFTGGASDAVEKGWAQQSTELKAYDAFTGDESELPALIPYIANKAAGRGLTIPELIEKIRPNANRYAAIAGTAEAMLDNYVEQLKAARSFAAMIAVLDTAKANTESFLAELG